MANWASVKCECTCLIMIAVNCCYCLFVQSLSIAYRNSISGKGSFKITKIYCKTATKHKTKYIFIWHMELHETAIKRVVPSYTMTSSCGQLSSNCMVWSHQRIIHHIHLWENRNSQTRKRCICIINTDLVDLVVRNLGHQLSLSRAIAENCVTCTAVFHLVGLISVNRWPRLGEH